MALPTTFKDTTMLNSQELYQQVSQLPSLEKLRLAELLLADLEMPNPEIDAIWREEAQKRWQAYKAGELKIISYESVIQKYKYHRSHAGKIVKVLSKSV